MLDPLKESYEALPYESEAHFESHPDALAVVATLRGLSTPPLDNCSILELGCATGGNLLPLAVTMPNARLVGIDMSPRQIDLANADARAIDARNVRFLVKSILEITPEFGQFDFIICHGVYSWVPPEVRHAILDVCLHNLAPNGIAYISYNTLPDWHRRGALREMMLDHARHAPDPASQVAKGRQLIELMDQFAAQLDPSMRVTLEREARLLRQSRDSYIAHEHFEKSNNPLYFHQFAQELAAHGLQYVGESPLSGGSFGRTVAMLAPFLRHFPRDIVDQEQYLDFARNSSFRCSVVCRAGAQLRPPAPDPVLRFHAEALVTPQSKEPRLFDASEERFLINEQPVISAGHPIVKTVLTTLWRAAPAYVPYPRLLEQVQELLSSHGLQDLDAAAALPSILLESYLGGIIDLHGHPTPFTLQPSQRPLASPVARLQARRGAPSFSNFRHRMVLLSEFDRALLPRLDGKSSLAQLSSSITAGIPRGEFSIREAGRPLTNPAQIAKALKVLLPAAIERIAHSALLLS